MSWAALLGLAGASYAFKALGPVFGGDRSVSPDVRAVLDILAVPLLAALIVTQTLDGGRRITFDPRLAGLAVAAVLVWRRAPFLLVVLAAAGTAALVRAL